MKAHFETAVAKNYSSNSQKIRVMSELWTEENIFCPNCGEVIKNLENNKPVSDFLCLACREPYEQKASKKKFAGKVLSSSYTKLIEKLLSKDKPHFFFLHYLPEKYFVQNFFVVPKYFFVPSIIEKRKALSKNARRAGWVGSNILFHKIPEFGKIYYITEGEKFSKKKVLEKWQQTAFLKDIKKDELKGWILDIMNCIETLGKKDFTLQEMYDFEGQLKQVHPENNNIKAKIRQQLQFLRDKGFLRFMEPGCYRLIHS